MNATSLPRPEYPRPQLRRERWINLNGHWRFAEDYAGWTADPVTETRPEDFDQTILVPFCRESELSGLHRRNFCDNVWYAREIEIPDKWKGERVLLNIGAADYETTVWLDGQRVGEHRGGHCSFSIDLTPAVRFGTKQTLVIKCHDDLKTHKPRGKQATLTQNTGCHYPQTTGIWQTVWLEPVPACRLERPRITPQVDAGAFLIEQRVHGMSEPVTVEVELLSEGALAATAKTEIADDAQGALWISVPAEDRRLWSPEDPHLYDLRIRLKAANGDLLDQIESYAGLRSVCIRGSKVLLNGNEVFQKLILDQGYYPDGLLTAPSDAALKKDIELSMEAGFNGARLHQKIFEERFLYHADRMGYLVWGELPDWGPGFQEHGPKSINAHWIEEWMEELERDYSHPCIVGWCPLNEQFPNDDTHLAELDAVMRSLVLATKLADRTRPVIDASGWIHRVPEADIWDAHDYAQEPNVFTERYGDPKRRERLVRGSNYNVPGAGRPFMLSEFGGSKWPPARDKDGNWGYGEATSSEEAFMQRFGGLCRAIHDLPDCMGYCYTQLTDVFQEQNGICYFDRTPKFELSRLAEQQAF